MVNCLSIRALHLKHHQHVLSSLFDHARHSSGNLWSSVRAAVAGPLPVAAVLTQPNWYLDDTSDQQMYNLKRNIELEPIPGGFSFSRPQNGL